MSVVKKFKSAALVAAMVAGTALTASSANALVIIPLTVNGNQATGQAGASVSGTGTVFLETFQFTVPNVGNFASSASTASVLDVTLSLSGGNIDFNPADLKFDGANIFSLVNPDPFENWSATITGLVGGTVHTIQVGGTLVSGTTASYSTQVNINAVPEPATWGMLLVGFGLVGAGMRSRKRSMVLA